MNKYIKLKNNVDLKTLAMNPKYELMNSVKAMSTHEYCPVVIWTKKGSIIEVSIWASYDDYSTTLSGLYELIKDGYVEKVEEE